MIQCEGMCGEYFHADDVRSCPECGIELCEECFQIHIKQCLAADSYEEDDDRETIDRECPRCGEELELDINVDGTSSLLCPNPKCDFEKDVTEELNKINIGYEEDEENEEEYA